MNIKSVLVAAMLAAAVGTGGAQAASLVGQEVTCSVAGGTGLSCAPSPFTITAGAPDPDAQVLSGLTPVLDIDFMDGWVDITFSGGESLPPFIFESPITLTLSGLLPANGAETSLRSLSISGVMGLTVANFMIAAGVLTIDLSGSTWDAGSAVGFDVAVPLPAPALLLLAGLAGLGFAARRRRPA